MLDEIYTELIAEHSRARENRRELANATITERGHNPGCGYEILGQNATCRASFYFYNTRRDVERLIEAIKSVRSVMRLA